ACNHKVFYSRFNTSGMGFTSSEFGVETAERELVRITDEIQSFVREAVIDEGILLVFSQHTTAGIIVNEDEPGLQEDVLTHLDEVAPPDNEYRHNQRGPGHDENADSHLKTIMTGADAVLPVENSRIQLGTYQQIFLVETDGPRERTVGCYLLGPQDQHS
ncbi:MAG: secondary thiamine-phosphate synthase enzyme YjbQ, partial [Candidatus Nanohaloarchaea archaeon]|nr:secondary thiamine-phosphate synthase enzyme YjbQ [Candidatus Nanohaloarchaea archaeon]